MYAGSILQREAPGYLPGKHSMSFVKKIQHLSKPYLAASLSPDKTENEQPLGLQHPGLWGSLTPSTLAGIKTLRLLYLSIKSHWGSVLLLVQGLMPVDATPGL